MKDIKNFLDEAGRLKQYPVKRPMKFLALEYLAGKFEKDKQYTEKEINALLEQWHTFGDPATLRRDLYDYRFLDRKPDGSAYWLEREAPVFQA